MIFLFQVMAGLILGGLFIQIGRVLRKERELFGFSLLLAAFWYLGFGVIDERTFANLLPQLLGGILFATLAIFGLRKSMAYTGIGWLSHAAWDFISPALADVSYMPDWNAAACLGFDVLLGIYILYWSGKSRHALGAETG